MKLWDGVAYRGLFVVFMPFPDCLYRVVFQRYVFAVKFALSCEVVGKSRK